MKNFKNSILILLSKISYIALTFSLLSCGAVGSLSEDYIPKNYTDLPDLELDPILFQYVREFEKEAKSRGLDISYRLDKLRQLTWDSLERPKVGTCTSHSNSIGTMVWTRVVVSPKLTNNTYIRAVMFHELGHCVLGLDHRGGEIASIMSPSLTNKTYYDNNWELLVDDLFCNLTYEDKLITCKKISLRP